MKTKSIFKKIVWIVLILAAFFITGCFTTSNRKSPPVPYRYSFAEDGDSTASIIFMKGDKVGVRLVDCEDVVMRSPVEGTYWEPSVLFPAEKPLNIRVYVYWDEDQFGERRRGIFKCPPLESGKDYKLWFRGSLKGGSLILTYANVSGVGSTAKERLHTEIVREQEIPPLK
jgi:hypothetical protein